MFGQGTPKPYETRILDGANELFVYGAGQVKITASGKSPLPRRPLSSSARVTVRMRATNTDKEISFSADLGHVEQEKAVTGIPPVFTWRC
jgi:hypothetical protein